jgi:hypothetical protein
MDASPRPVHRLFQPGPLNTYTAYSVGSFLAWAVIWAILAVTEPPKILGYVFAIFFGWVIGWGSASIGRALYPPPTKRYSWWPS